MNELEQSLRDVVELDLLVQILVLLGWGDAAYIYARLLTHEYLDSEFQRYQMSECESQFSDWLE